jgi:hypothetical protein
MATKIGQQESSEDVLVSVTAEMAKPRVVASAKKVEAGEYSWIAPSGKRIVFRSLEPRIDVFTN